MFGVSRESMVQMVRGNPYQISMGRDAGNLMLAMSILSDVQEILYFEDDPEANRQPIQWINKAKFVINQVMEDLEHDRKVLSVQGD
jgi:hypothetical protein